MVYFILIYEIKNLNILLICLYTSYLLTVFFSFTELSSKVKELERSKRLLIKDKEVADNEVSELKTKISNMQKDNKEIKGQRKQAMEEFGDLNDKLAEVRSQKMKLSRLVREKEEEIENTMNKLDQSRQELRASEKNKRELLTQVEELKADLHTETKLRAKADLYCQQLEDEIDSVKSKKYVGASHKDQDQEVSKLKSKIDKLKRTHEEALAKANKKFSVDIKVSRIEYLFTLYVEKIYLFIRHFSSQFYLTFVVFVCICTSVSIFCLYDC